MARPSKYTPETVKRIVEAIRLGATFTLACKYAGIDYSTFARWLHTKREFCEAIKEAEGRAAVRWLTKIEQAASAGNWQAAAWKLERRYPQEYGRRLLVDVEQRIRRAAEEAGLDPDAAVAEAMAIVRGMGGGKA